MPPSMVPMSGGLHPILQRGDAFADVLAQEGNCLWTRQKLLGSLAVHLLQRQAEDRILNDHVRGARFLQFRAKGLNLMDADAG